MFTKKFISNILKNGIFLSLFFLILLSVAFAVCVNPANNSVVTSETEYCAGTFNVQNISITGNNFNVRCIGTVMNGTNSSSSNRGIFIHDSYNVTFAGCNLTKIGTTAFPAIYVNRSDNVTIANNTVYPYSIGLLLQNTDNSTIDSNRFYPAADGNGIHAIVLGKSIYVARSNSHARNNNFRNNWVNKTASAISWFNIGENAINNIIYNLSVGNDGNGNKVVTDVSQTNTLVVTNGLNSLRYPSQVLFVDFFNDILAGSYFAGSYLMITFPANITVQTDSCPSNITYFPGFYTLLSQNRINRASILEQGWLCPSNRCTNKQCIGNSMTFNVVDFQGTEIVNEGALYAAGNPTTPIIENITTLPVHNVGDFGQYISWTTDAITNTTVRYGADTSLDNVTSSASLSRTHHVILGNLSTAVYYYNITACKPKNNTCATEGPFSFTGQNVSCWAPIDDMSISASLTFCNGVYDIPNGITLAANDMALNCNSTNLTDSSGAATGISISSAYDNVSIYDCILTSYATAIDADNTNGVFANNKIISDAGFYFGGNIGGAGQSNISIHNNTIRTNGGNAAFEVYSSGLSIYNNTITNGDIQIWANNMRVYNNNLLNQSRTNFPAISASYNFGWPPDMANSLYENNTITLNGGYGTGIEISSPNNTARSNRIINASGNGITVNIFASTDSFGTLISNNVIENSDYGIYMYAPLQNTTLSNNTISNITTSAIFTNGAINITLTFNNGSNSLRFENKDIDLISSSTIFIANGIAAVNTSLEPAMNLSANITLANVSCPSPVFSYPIFTKNRTLVATQGSVCNDATNPACANAVCSGSTLTFNVNHFSSFAGNITTPVVSSPASAASSPGGGRGGSSSLILPIINISVLESAQVVSEPVIQPKKEEQSEIPQSVIKEVIANKKLNVQKLIIVLVAGIIFIIFLILSLIKLKPKIFGVEEITADEVV